MAAYPARRASGIGNWDLPRYTTRRGRPLPKNTTYSAFWTGFCLTCLRMQWLGSSVGLGTTVRLGPRKNVPYSGVTLGSVGCCGLGGQVLINSSPRRLGAAIRSWTRDHGGTLNLKFYGRAPS